MSESRSDRRPGRPKNSGRHQGSDAVLLPAIAERKLANCHQPLAAIIREVIDTERDTGGIRRLQRAFRAQGDSLMKAAILRRQERRHREFTQSLVLFADGVHQAANIFVGRLDAWTRSPEGQRTIERLKRFEQAANTFVGRFDAWSRSPEGQQAIAKFKRLEQAANSPEMRKWLLGSLSQKPPLFGPNPRERNG